MRPTSFEKRETKQTPVTFTVYKISQKNIWLESSLLKLFKV